MTMHDPTQPITTPGGLRLDPAPPVGTVADAWEGGTHRIVVMHHDGSSYLMTFGYGQGLARKFAGIDDALAAIDAVEAEYERSAATGD